MIKYSAEVRRLAKRANQRMVEMEKHGYKSPAYRAAQASLEMMGRRSNKATGRRFSETGKGTENELRQQLSELQKFLGQQTSTIRGYKKYRKDIYEGANKQYNLVGAGISQGDFEYLWEEIPDNEKDRKYYASFYIEVLQAYELKVESGEIKEENRLTITDMIRILEGSKNLKSALKKIGIDISDIIENRERLFGRE